MLVRALATGNCDLICDTTVERIDTEGGKHATGVRLVQQLEGSIQRRIIRAGHVVVAAGAIESARLLLNSATESEPDGIGNRSGQVGRNLQGHVYSGAYGLFDEPIQDGLGPGVSIATFRFDHSNEGIIGEGCLLTSSLGCRLFTGIERLPRMRRDGGAQARKPCGRASCAPAKFRGRSKRSRARNPEYGYQMR